VSSFDTQCSLQIQQLKPNAWFLHYAIGYVIKNDKTNLAVNRVPNGLLLAIEITTLYHFVTHITKHYKQIKLWTHLSALQTKWTHFNYARKPKQAHTCRKAQLHKKVTHTHPFNGPFLGLRRRAGTRKVKPIWILLKQETVSGSGISWAVCTSAPRSRQITMPAPHHSVFYRPDALPATQPTVSKHWRQRDT